MQMHQSVEQVEVPIVERHTPMVAIGEFLQLALGSGIVTLVAVGLLAWAVGVTVKLALGLAGLVMLAFLVVFSVRVWRGWFTVETVRAACPTHQVRRDRVEVEVTEPGARRMTYWDLPGDQGKLEALARGVLNGQPFSEGTWSGGGRPYSLSEFRELRAQLLDRGVLQWRNQDAPAQGVALTRVGQAVFQRIAEDAHAHAHARGGGPVTALLRQQQGRGNGSGGGDYVRLG